MFKQCKRSKGVALLLVNKQMKCLKADGTKKSNKGRRHSSGADDQCVCVCVCVCEEGL